MITVEKTSKNEIYSLMEEFPFLSFFDIKTIALSLEIQGIYNEENILTEENYNLLRDKLLERAENNMQDYSEYEEYEENNLSIDTNSFKFDTSINSVSSTIDQVENIPEDTQKTKVQDYISIREIQLKHKLKEAFIFQSINALNIKDIHGNVIEANIDPNYIYVYIDDSEKIVKKTNKLNAANANQHKPFSTNTKTPANAMTMSELAEKYDISLSVLINIAKDLGFTYIYNGNSYTHINNCMKIVEEAKNKLNAAHNQLRSLKIVKKASAPVKESNLFEEIIKKDTLVFIDTSSLMNDDMPKIVSKNIIPVLQKYNKTVFITDSVINEIAIKINQSNNAENQRKAISAKNILSKLVEHDLYQVPETYSVNKNFADAELISIFSDLRLKYNLCLITNDNSTKKGGGLSNCIMNLQTSTCMDEGSIKKITVFYVGKEKLIEYSNNRDVKFKLHEKSPIRVIL